MQCVGAADQHLAAEVVPRHRDPHGVEVTAHDLCRGAPQCSQVGAHRTRHVVDDPACQTQSPMRGDGFGGGLLQGLVGEQPLPRVGQFGDGPRRSSVVSMSTGARAA